MTKCNFTIILRSGNNNDNLLDARISDRKIDIIRVVTFILSSFLPIRGVAQPTIRQ